jgi:hypothetical protein
MKNFLITCTLALILLLSIVSIAHYYSLIKIVVTPFYFTAPFIMIITIIFHLFLIKAATINSKQFINRFLAASGIKIFLYLLVIVIFIFTIKFHIKVFLISYLISYCIYTFIEVSFILKFLKNNISK